MVPLSGLVDTGCPVCLIGATAVFKKCQLETTETKRELFVVGDMNNADQMTIAEGMATLSINGVEASDWVMMVVPDVAIPTDILIGRSFLNLPSVNFFKRGNDFVIEQLDNSAIEELPSADESDNIKVCYVDSFNETVNKCGPTHDVACGGNREECTPLVDIETQVPI